MKSTFYVWKENQEEYTAIPKKQELINRLLRVYFDKKRVGGGEVVREVPPTAFNPKTPDPELGYPCCQKAKPCKHWAWSGVESAWRNELTGKLREVI